MKWVARILYAIALGVVTFMVIMMSNVSKVQEFKDDSLDKLYAEEATQAEINDFIISYAAYTKTDFSYHQMEPAYTFKGSATDQNIEGEDKTSFQIDVSIYLVHLFNERDGVNVDGYLFLINNDFLVNLSDNEVPKIGITSPILTIEFNEPLRTINDQGEVSIDKDNDDNDIISISLTLDSITRGDKLEAFYGFAFPAGLRKYENKDDIRADSFVEMTRIEFKYNTETNKTKTVLSLVNNATTDGTRTPNPDAITDTESSREFSLNKDNSFLSWLVPKEEAETTPGIYVAKFDLSGYDYIMVRNILILSAVALVLTYLLFFNKIVVAYVREKRNQKQYAEHKDDKADAVNVDTSQIFNDSTSAEEGPKRKRK